MGPQLRKPYPMGPQPRELQPRDIFLYESLGIAFFEALFYQWCRFHVADHQMPEQSPWLLLTSIDILFSITRFNLIEYFVRSITVQWFLYDCWR